jgi:hypothetical protein
MTSSNFMIGPIKEGLRKDVKPYAIPEDAFETLTNAYQFRGRILRRSGYTLLGNLANGTPVMGLKTRELFGIDQKDLIAFDTTDSYLFSGGAFIPLPSVMPVTWSGADWQFFWTVNYAQAFWATNSKPGLNGWNISAFAGSAGIGNAATVNVTSAGNNVQVGDYVYFINLSPAVVGNAAILAIVTAAGNPFTVQAINQSVGSTFTWTNGVTATGMVLDSMQTVAGQDGIRYYGDLTNGTGWANYNPPIDLVNVLAGALMIFPYRGYLVFLNTIEGNDQGTFNFQNRARWTQIGTPYYSEPVPIFPNPQTFDIRAVRDDLFGRGGANDAPTNEAIVSAGFIRDVLVVYFETSTWRLRFVNNSQNPFVWERINIELGSDCTFSAIAFDKGLMAIGQRGIVISDANDTSRFDEKIPNDIFDIRQTEHGLQRVNGIRTFRTRLNYWTIPASDHPDGIYPDKVLVFNYDTKNWSYFDDCFTCFGYYYPQTNLLTWGDLVKPWSSYGDLTWDSGTSQAEYENIIAGNQQGFVFILEQTDSTNDPSLNISNIVAGVVTSANHNLPDGSWITLTGVTGTTSDDGVSLNNRNFKIANPTNDPNTFTLTEFQAVNAGLTDAIGLTFSYTIGYTPIIPGSVQINVGSVVFTDLDLNGILTDMGLNTGTINYDTGAIVLNFNPAQPLTQVNIRVVSPNPLQSIDPFDTTGAYTGGGQITKISGIDIQTKIFNFFNDDQSSRLSKIDFYVNSTTNGQFTCNVFADASNESVNTPLADNPFSNVVLTSPNPYQIQTADQAIYRLYCDAVAQTVQLQLTLSDQQMAVNAINSSDIEILSMIFTLRRGGRLV